MARTAYTNANNLCVQYSGTNIIGVGGKSSAQSDCMTALHFNMIPNTQRSNVLWLLVNSSYGITNFNSGYTNNGYTNIYCTNHLSTGYFFASREMLELSRDGYTPLAYWLLMDTNFPSWLYPVTVGSTTIWEGWNTYLAGPANPGSLPVNDRGYYPQILTSFNHLPYGAVGEWIWKIVAGINPDDGNPGFKNVIIEPQPGGGITNVFALFSSIHGPIACTWTNSTSARTFSLTITNPANTTASVYLPCTNSLGNMLESGVSAAQQYPYYTTNPPGFTNGAVVFQVGSGGYKFTVSNVDL